MKRINHLAPGTIRHRHGALARCFDWMLRKHSEIMAQNPMRLLKRGFATYTNADIDMLAKQGLEPRVDEERDRRLAPDEEQRIRKRLQGHADELAVVQIADEGRAKCLHVQVAYAASTAAHISGVVCP